MAAKNPLPNYARSALADLTALSTRIQRLRREAAQGRADSERIARELAEAEVLIGSVAAVVRAYIREQEDQLGP